MNVGTYLSMYIGDGNGSVSEDFTSEEMKTFVHKVKEIDENTTQEEYKDYLQMLKF